MNKIATRIFIAVLIPGLALAIADKPDGVESQKLQLAPTQDQRFISRITQRYLDGYHYKPATLDDTMSREILRQYLDSLDPAKAYFLQSDVDYFERYRDQLDDYLKRDQVDPAFEIFNLYRQRVRERVGYALSLLDKGFDFTVDESINLDHEDQQWAVNQAALEDYWRKRVKNDWLRLKLTDKESDKIKETLTKRYNMLGDRMDEIKPIEVFTWFINAYTQAIEPHTNYFSPRDSEAFDISMSLSLEGIGAVLQRDGEYTAIRSIVSGGPAYLDGRLQPGDRIISVAQNKDGEWVDVIGWRLDDVVDLIRGPKDSTVRLEVLPEDKGEAGPSQEVQLVRNEIKLEAQAAKKEIINVPQGDEIRKLGVIRLPSFYVDMAGRAANRPGYRSSTMDVRRLIYELKAAEVDGLIIDLRDNGGGALSEAITMTGLFIDSGPVVQVKDSRGRVKVEHDFEPGTAWDGPLAVLVNRYSASASEIFAGAIQDYQRGLVIGEATFGKGTVQNLIDLNGGYSSSEEDRYGQLKLTVAQFFRVNGESTQKRGVIPDVILPSTGDLDERGESGYENALPWTKITPATYQPAAMTTPLIDQLAERHQERLDVEPQLRYLLDEIETYNRNQERTTISLLESARRAEIDEKNERKARKATVSALEHITFDDDDPERPGQLISAPEEDEEEDDSNLDVYLDESARILADFISLSGQEPYMAMHENTAKSTNSEAKPEI